MVSTQHHYSPEDLIDKYNVLVVDDEEGNLKAIKRSFRRTKYQVYTASSAKEALRILKQHHFKVVLSDFRMPDIDGGTLVKKIKQCYPNIVSMILTAYADFDSAMSVMNTGVAYKFLTKPWSNEQLINEVDQAFTEYEQRLSNTSAGKLSKKYIKPDRVNFDKTIQRLIADQTEFSLISIIVADISLHDHHWTQTQQGITLEYVSKIIDTCPLESYEVFNVDVDQLLVISTKKEQAETLHQKLIMVDKALSLCIDNEQIVPKLQCHFAYALAPFEGMEVAQLLHSIRSISEQEYRDNKRSGDKAHIIHLDTKYMTEKKRKKSIQNSIQQAINTNQFSLYYQPKVRLEDGIVETAEVLMRWQHASLGWVSPVEFIGLSELDGQIQAIGDWLIENSINQLIDFKKRFNGNIKLAINISPRQLQSNQIIEELTYLLKRTGINPACLELEITEGCIIEDLTQTADILWQLKHLGVNIAIDDFGSGYSSFAYLSKLPVDVLKLDKILIDDLGINTGVNDMLQSIIDLCHRLNIEVVAEGVEQQDQVELLRDYGCHYIQGYVYSKPVTKDEFETILINQPFKLMA
ncbi:EAL domain-containing protein [Psychromonas sp. KJ10-10]|uniref:EAL domain-containing response regulator n=1 Tax=Psychromonas sp. KJ10-10 TaxID=3391823 RepID=UPI0039B56CE2